MAFIDTTTTKPPRPPGRSRQRWPRKPSGPNAQPSLGDVGQPTAPAPEVGQPAPTPPAQNGSGPQPVTVNPLPMPGQPRTSRPAIATPQLSDVTVAQPDILGTVQGVLQPELTSEITQDPRYLSAMSQLKQKQEAEKLQRKNDMIRLGIVADDGSNFSNFDTLDQKQTIEQQNLLSVIQGIRQQDTTNALALGGQQYQIGQGNVQNRLQAVGQEADISLKQQAQDLATQIQTGQLSIAQANQKMQEAGQAGGQFVLDAFGKAVWQPTQAASEFTTTQTGVTPTGQSTLAKVGQEAGIAAQSRGLDIQQQAQDLSNKIQTGQLTLDQAKTQVQNQVALGQLTLDQANQILAQAQVYGVGPQGQQTLQAVGQSADIALKNRAQALAEGEAVGEVGGRSTLEKIGQEAGIEATRAGLTGVAPLYNPDGTPAIDPATGQQRTGTTLDAQKLGLSQAQVFGKAGPISAGTMTEEAQQNRAQNALTQQGLTINDSNLKAQVQIQQAKDAGTAYDPSTGKWVTSVEARTAASTIAYQSGMLAEQNNARIKQNQLDFATLTGLVGDPLTGTVVKTVAQKELDQRTTIENAQQQLQRDIAEADRIGQMDGIDTIQYRQAMQAISESQAKVDQAWTDLTGSVPGDTSPLAGTKSVEQQTLELTKINAALQRAIDQGKATGKFIDPITGKDQTTLEAEISRGTLGVQQAQQSATERANLYQMTGRAPLLGADGKAQMGADGKPTMMDTLENRIKTGELALSQANTYGSAILIDPKTGAVQYTTDSKGNIVPITQTAINADIAKRGMTDQENRTALAQQEQYGGFTDPKTGKFMPTQAATQWSDQQKQNYAKLSEETRATKAQEKLALADRLGYTDSAPGKTTYGDFREAFDDSNAGLPFDTSMDLNANGKVDLEDYFEMDRRGLIAAPGKTFSTIQAKQVDAQIQNAKDVLGLDQQRVTNAVNQYNSDYWQKQQAFYTEAQGYVTDGYGNPIEKIQKVKAGSFNTQGLDRISALLQANNGTITRNTRGFFPEAAAFDLNDDNTITMNEVLDAMSIAEAQGNGAWDIYKQEKAPVTTLQRDQFNTQKDQFNVSTTNQVDQFLKSIGMTMDQIRAEEDSNKFSAWMGLLATVVGGASTIAGAAVGNKQNPSGSVKVTIGTGGVKIGT